MKWFSWSCGVVVALASIICLSQGLHLSNEASTGLGILLGYVCGTLGLLAGKR